MSLTQADMELISEALGEWLRARPQLSFCEAVDQFAYYHAPTDVAYREWKAALSSTGCD